MQWTTRQSASFPRGDTASIRSVRPWFELDQQEGPAHHRADSFTPDILFSNPLDALGEPGLRLNRGPTQALVSRIDAR